MAGNIGSPLCAELNRIANNGVYPDRDDFLEEQGAANVWAGTTGQGLLGALNYIVDPNRTENNFSDLTKVCNELAGTTGLSDVDALRTINHAAEVLLRGTTPQSAVFSTDAATPRYNYPGYIYLPGIAGQYISTPDAAALDITGDIDIRVRVAFDDWTPLAGSTLAGKWLGSGNQRSWYLLLNTDGTLNLVWSNDGTTIITKTSTSATGITDATIKWIRATLDVDNEAVGNDVKFYTSDDGATWTQLGSTVTTAGVTSIYSGTAVLEVGSFGGGASPSTGKFYRAQIFAGLTGTDKRLDVDLTTNVTSATYDQFTATTGQLCTINGQNTLTNAGKAGALLPTTVGSSLAADSNDPKFLAHDGTNYVYLTGVAQNTLSVPDSAALDITGDIDVRVRIAMDDWTPAAAQTLASKNDGTSNSWRFDVNTTGVIRFIWTTDGVTANQIVKSSTVAPTIADGSVKWIRVTLDVDNGASGNDVKFWTSDDGTTWTQLGTTVTTAGVTSIWAGTSNVEIGSYGSLNTGNIAGKVYRAQIYSDITGTTKVLDVDTSVITTGAATSFTAVTGQTVTINRSTSGRKTVAVTQPTWLFGTDDYMEVNNRWLEHTGANYLYLPGVASNYASAPDSAALDVTGDIDLRVKVALDDWTPTAQQVLMTKQQSATQRSYALRVSTAGLLEILWSVDGSTLIASASTVATGLADGATKWVRATLDVDNGASGNTTTYFLSDDGITWTQLGATVVTAGVTSIYSSTSVLEIGGRFLGANDPARGKFFRAQILNGIGGTVAFDANFESSITTNLPTTFTESSANAATVTINYSGTAYRSAGVIASTYVFPGATNTFKLSAYSLLDFGATDSFTVFAVTRQWETTQSYCQIFSKYLTASGAAYWTLGNWNATGRSQFAISDGTLSTSTSGETGTYSAGSLVTLTGVRSTAADTIQHFNNATAAGTAVTDTTTGSLSTTAPVLVGRSQDGGTYQNMEFFAAAIFRSVLTPKNLADIRNYFNGRD